MTFTVRKAVGLTCLGLLAASAPPLEARSLWKTLFGAAAVVTGWCLGQALPGQPLAPPVPTAAPPAPDGPVRAEYPWVWLDAELGHTDQPTSGDGRPYPWEVLQEAPPTYPATHLPSCVPPQQLPGLHAALDQALVHYPPGKCPGPLREHLPRERAAAGPRESPAQLVEALDSYDACRHYELATQTRLETLDQEVACALRAVRELKRSDRGLQMMERLEDAVRLHDDLLAEMRRARAMAAALADAIWKDRHPRSRPAKPAWVEDGLGDQEAPPLDERLALIQWLHREMEAASKRFNRKVLPVVIAMLPDGGARKKHRRDYCHRLQAEEFAAEKSLKFLPERPGFPPWENGPLLGRRR